MKYLRLTIYKEKCFFSFHNVKLMSLTVVKILWVHYIIADGITKEICARGEMVMCMCLCIILFLSLRGLHPDDFVQSQRIAKDLAITSFSLHPVNASQ